MDALKARKIIILGMGVLLALSPIYADVATARIQDDSTFRTTLLDAWFTEVPSAVLAKRPITHTLPGGDRIQVRAEPGEEEFNVVLARELDGAYPGWAQGSWILTRRREDGSFSRIRIFLRSDPYTYIQFRPMDGNRSLMDVVLYDGYIIRSQQIYIPFNRLLVIPVEEALRAAGPTFPRRYFDPHSGQYQDLRSLVSQVRSHLPGLSFRDDGAIDQHGDYVYIDTLELQEGRGGLNCSGFAKWLVDGILWPITEGYLPIEPLKAAYGSRGSSLTEPYEAQRDPFFGLDWTRNLAAQANRVLRSPAFMAIDEIEIRNAPFSSVILRNGTAAGTVRPYPGFLLNAGFGIEGLHALLYTLAIDEPGRIYLASVNTDLDPAPRMRQHFHVAVLIPYFNEYGNFQIAVFESAAETNFNQFKNRYPGHYVNLVRIPVEGMFTPRAGEYYVPAEPQMITPGQNLFFYGIKR